MQELAALKTSGGGDAETAVETLPKSPLAGGALGGTPEFSEAGRVVQLADLPPGALPTSVSPSLTLMHDSGFPTFHLDPVIQHWKAPADTSISESCLRL